MFDNTTTMVGPVMINPSKVFVISVFRVGNRGPWLLGRSAQADLRHQPADPLRPPHGLPGADDGPSDAAVPRRGHELLVRSDASDRGSPQPVGRWLAIQPERLIETSLHAPRSKPGWSGSDHGAPPVKALIDRRLSPKNRVTQAGRFWAWTSSTSASRLASALRPCRKNTDTHPVHWPACAKSRSSVFDCTPVRWPPACASVSSPFSASRATFGLKIRAE